MKKLLALCLLVGIVLGIQQQATVLAGEHEMGPGPHGAPLKDGVNLAAFLGGPGPIDSSVYTA